ncbi:MAG: amidohydrolase family protein [Anaerolineaceae bacterium]|nr:amidohydrolase family protein [Anaerolineaceae bacterium]
MPDILKFFDLNTSIGVWMHPNYGGFETADELVAVLDYLQVDRAVVYHAQAHETHAPMGNQMLMEELTGHPRLLPSWVIFTHFTGEMPEPALLVEDMLAQGVRIVRMLPGYKGHRFSLEPWSAGKLLEKLDEHRIPTLIDFMFFRRDDPDWKLLYDLCQRYPRLPIILTGWSGLASRSFFALCQVCPNLYLDTSRYALFRGMEAFVSQIGARQLLYGSGMPRMSAGVAMTTITHAFISDEEKRLIASENLDRLLSEVIL